MTHEHEGKWGFEGSDGQGRRFRPGDWIARISTALAKFASDHRLHYANEVQPCVIRGERCLVVGKALAQRSPDLYAYIMRFAHDNRLRIQEERRTWALPMGIERRNHIGP